MAELKIHHCSTKTIILNVKFTQQTLNGHEAMNMPLLFHLDTDLPEKVHTVTLSYTLFDVTDKG